ncbi:MAG: IgGFc-binding protein [Myxococcales bacterium]|nr:IgGFc-binding protein [Myxococcales bacterium]
MASHISAIRSLVFMLVLGSACSAGEDALTGGSSAQGGSGGAGGGFGVGGGPSGTGGGPLCGPRCTLDAKTVLECDGAEIATCGAGELCDLTVGACRPACTAAKNNKSSVGCEYYSVFLDSYVGEQACYVAIVANTSELSAHVDVTYEGAAIDLASFGFIPVGSGPDLELTPFDPAEGLAPSEALLVFLSGLFGDAGPRCRIPSALPTGVQVHARSGIGSAFHITTDVPVVAYQINPFGGASAAVTGSSLLLPTSAWDTTYLGLGPPSAFDADLGPMVNIVAMEDQTEVEVRFRSGWTMGGGGISPGEPGTPAKVLLNRGQHAQILTSSEMTGNAIIANKPVGVFTGAPCFNLPTSTAACDHVEQMVPPGFAFASEAVGVMPRPRGFEDGYFRVVALADGTELSYSTDVGGPMSLDAGRSQMFATEEPFVVRSQDEEHPFVLISHMSGGDTPGVNGAGDPEMVLVTPPAQFLERYVFFADPTYSESTIVVIREKEDGVFKPVMLDCAGEIDGFIPVGEYEWARVDLTTGDFEGVRGCSSGRRVIESEAPFGVSVWGWATPEFSPPGYASYGYPAGMNVRQVNQVPIVESPE